MEIPTCCHLCPRACGVNRLTQTGFCHGGAKVKLARAALHFWEEPCISGTRGSGTVFFSGCPLQCCYCQNYTISAENFGKEITVPTLAEIFIRLQQEGAHNINLVTATHYLPWVLQALRLAKPRLHIPIVYNTSGYETCETLQQLEGIVDIYLTDLKYVSSDLGLQYSGAADYFAVASLAVQEMCRQTGAPVLDADGILQRGVIVRHLALPGTLSDSKAVLQFLAQALPKDGFLLSLMSQYVPAYHALQHPQLKRRIATYEYRTAVDTAVTLGLTGGYLQQKSSAQTEYTPVFDLAGIS